MPGGPPESWAEAAWAERSKDKDPAMTAMDTTTTTRRKITLTASVGTDGIVHLEGQARPGADGRLHIHVQRGSAQEAKLLRWLDAEPGEAAEVRAVRREAAAAGYRLHYDSGAGTCGLSHDGLGRPLHNLTQAQAVVAVS